MLIRSRLLRENGRYLPEKSFLMHKSYFNDPENGYFKVAQQRPAVMQNPMAGTVPCKLLFS